MRRHHSSMQYGKSTPIMHPWQYLQFIIPPSQANHSTHTVFLDEFVDHMENFLTINNNVVIAGDFNLHIDNDDDPVASSTWWLHWVLTVMLIFQPMKMVTAWTWSSLKCLVKCKSSNALQVPICLTIAPQNVYYPEKKSQLQEKVY